MDIIVYHKNCMDGLASAFIAKKALEEKGFDEEILTMPLQYGEELEFFEELDHILDCVPEKIYVFFVDFSFKKNEMVRLLNTVNIEKVEVIDHHKTAQAELNGLSDEFDNFKLVYDVNKSGATLCYDYFQSDLDKGLFDYIEDRDLWKWNLPNSKEISEYLRLAIEPNDIESFQLEHTHFNFDYALAIGKALVKKQEQQVESKTKKVNSIFINGVMCSYVNATENISEIGNRICNKYQTPALVFFLNDKKEYVCSLRSLDTLPDVSEVAKSFGGGGHRNAAGFTLNQREFSILFYDVVPTYREVEFAIKDWYIKNDYPNKINTEDKDWFVTRLETMYKTKVLQICFQDSSLDKKFAYENIDDLFIDVYKYFKEN